MRLLLNLTATGVVSAQASSLMRTYHNQATSITGSQVITDGYGFPFSWRVTYAELPTLDWLAFVLDVYFFMLLGYVLVLGYKQMARSRILGS